MITAEQSLNVDGLAMRAAFTAAQLLRPYKADPRLLASIVPAGGNWQYERNVGTLITWNGITVAQVNPDSQLPANTEGEIAMAMRALPAMDAALRIILALAKSPSAATPDGIELIARVAETVVAHIEMPVPGFAGAIDADGDA